MPLTVLITSADGSQYRLGPDEPDAAWVPENITWESVVPGGWKTGSFNLRRRIDEDVPLRLLDEVEIIDEHGQTVYEGRIHKLPRQHGDDYLLGVECLGWAAHLLDDTSFREIYVDRDMSRWGDANLARRIAFGTAAPYAADYNMESADQAVVFNGTDGKAITVGSGVETMYAAPKGVLIEKVSYKSVEANTSTVEAATLYGSDSEDMSSAGSVGLIMDDTLRGATLPAPKRFLMLRALATGTHTPAAGSPFRRIHKLLGVYGDHGLAVHEVSGGTEPGGFYIDDILADAIGRACPKLNFTVGEGGSIERPALVVPHASYPDAGPVENVLLDLNKYVLWDWLVYENRTLFYRPTDPDRLTWEARLDRGIHLSLEGDDAEHVYNGCVVKYPIPDGRTQWSGPTGSGFDVESGLLGDTDPENTVNQHGYPRRWIQLDISFPTLAEYAITIGAAYLAQASLPARSGDIVLRGEVEHPTMGMRPVREVRAGDWIRLSDHPADVPRRIISSRHSNDGRETSVTVGNDMNKVDALLEQLGVVTKVRLG